MYIGHNVRDDERIVSCRLEDTSAIEGNLAAEFFRYIVIFRL